MSRYVLGFEEIDPAQLALVGGKGAHLAELSRLEGLRVPAGFCVTTGAFRRVLTAVPALDERLERLSRLKPDDRDAIHSQSADLRRLVEGLPLPGDVAAEIAGALARLGEHGAYAVRSSATAEDLPTASFAGQQDTYLNVVGPESILQHVSRCWASLFSERAVAYRLRNGFDHRKVLMAVVVQRMVFPRASGVLFTADPVTAHRKLASVEASFGLGEALVSGVVNADAYSVRDGELVSKAIAAKPLAISAVATGGTRAEPRPPERQHEPALTDAQVLALVALGRRIEAHFGRPQDIEWCLVDGGFHFVQSRPITTLFPIPDVGDGEHHVYLSVGHQQMMTDAMRPLGLSVHQLVAMRPMFEAGGRLFVDVTQALASPRARAGLVEMAGKEDPLTSDALRVLIARGFVPSLPDAAPGGPPLGASPAPAPLPNDPAIVVELIRQWEASLATLEHDLRAKSGVALLDFIEADVKELKRLLLDARSRQATMAGIEATWWLNDRLHAWLGEKNAADVLAQSAPNNVTSQMGLALLDVADAIRPHRAVVAFLENVEDVGFLDGLLALDGGPEARDAIRAWLDVYGMRCVGEIDLTQPRWVERPSSLVPLLLGLVRSFSKGEGARRFERGRQEAAKKEAELLARLRALPDGEPKAQETKRMIERVRTFIGYREYPKYGIVNRYFAYKQAIVAEAERLVQAGVLCEREDAFFLRFEELRDVLRADRVDEALIQRRKQAFRSYQALTPPRVLTSDGEVIAGSYRREGVPAGALVGHGVSTGTIEGRARVVRDMAEANVEAGDILVTTSTDPSWTPLFVSVAGLVTEVGGLMTHGSVIAREYGLPAVVGVANATRLIRDGQRIRVHGTDGYVELLG